jgi:hypothetical protein
MDNGLNFKKMRNKLNLKEGEVQRILGLHKQAILKENNYQVLNEEQTFSLKVDTDFDPSSNNSEDYTLRLYRGTTFKPSPNIKNSLVTDRQVRIDYVYGIFNSTAGASGINNKAFVVYNCKTKRMYTVQSTKIDEFDYKKTKWTYDAKNMQSLNKLCEESVVKNQEVIKPEQKKLTDDEKIKKAKACGHKTWKDYQASGWKCKKENQKNTFLANGTSGTRYSFDFETIMKAIDDTGKCPRSGTSDQAGTSGTSGVQGTSGTQGTSGVGAPVVIQKPTVTKDDFYQWTMD